ncbi:hypothetical protein L083_1406 [Actinoplanes sp. N902-109]|nr:hypothetical protein L083_1406 [Actinoplanes sp. N902-109]
MGGRDDGAGDTGAYGGDTGASSRQFPLIGPAVNPKDVRPFVAGGAGPYFGSGAGCR